MRNVHTPGRIGLSAGLMSWVPAALSAAFAFDAVAPVLERVAGFPSFCFGATFPSCALCCDGRLFPTANLPSLNICAGVAGWICIGCGSLIGDEGVVGIGDVGDIDGPDIADKGGSGGGCAGGGIGGSTGDGVSPGISPYPCIPRCAGLGRTDEGADAGKSGVLVAERVARVDARLLLDAPLEGLRSAGEGRLRAGRLVVLDSSPLEEALGRFAPAVVELRRRPVGWEDEGTGRLFAVWG